MTRRPARRRLSTSWSISKEACRMSRILVVEDEPGIALGLEDTLRLSGYDVDVLSDGSIAAVQALQQPYDLLLLDVMLPGKDGFELCAELRQRGMKAPIILLTARGLERDRNSRAGSRGQRLCHETVFVRRADGQGARTV